MQKEEQMKYYKCMKLVRMMDLNLKKRKKIDRYMIPLLNKMKILPRNKMNLTETFHSTMQTETSVTIYFNFVNFSQRKYLALN